MARAHLATCLTSTGFARPRVATFPNESPQ